LLAKGASSDSLAEFASKLAPTGDAGKGSGISFLIAPARIVELDDFVDCAKIVPEHLGLIPQ